MMTARLPRSRRIPARISRGLSRNGRRSASRRSASRRGGLRGGSFGRSAGSRGVDTVASYQLAVSGWQSQLAVGLRTANCALRRLPLLQLVDFASEFADVTE